MALAQEWEEVTKNTQILVTFSMSFSGSGSVSYVQTIVDQEHGQPVLELKLELPFCSNSSLPLSS